MVHALLILSLKVLFYSMCRYWDELTWLAVVHFHPDYVIRLNKALVQVMDRAYIVLVAAAIVVYSTRQRFVRRSAIISSSLHTLYGTVLSPRHLLGAHPRNITLLLSLVDHDDDRGYCRYASRKKIP